ncbi:MAG: thioesterase domain-containing protein [Planctomycetota bacterium]
MSHGHQWAEPSTDLVIPRTAIERRLARIWAELLCKERIGIRDDFFELGGHSLLAVRLFAEIKRAFDKTLPLSTLFRASTLVDLANVISQDVQISADSTLVPLQTSGERIPLFLIPPAASTSLQFINVVRELGNDQPVYGIDPVGLYDERSHLETVEEIASYNVREIRKVQAKGPYLIGGICFGVRVAYEMAQQLSRQGQEVGLLIAFDSSPPRLKPKLTFYLKRYISGIASHLRKRKGAANRLEEEFSPEQIESNGNIPEELHRRTRIILQLNQKARRRYFARKYNGPVALLESEQVRREKNVYSKWINAVRNGIDYYTTIPGSSHYGLFFEEQYYKILAERLNQVLSDFHTARKDRF